MPKITVGRLKDWCIRFDSEEELELELDCFHGTAYLKVKKPRGWERIDLSNGSIQGLETGRLSSAFTVVQELKRES